MRRGQNQPGCDQRAGAKIAARADDGDDGTADALGRQRATADDRGGGREREQRQARDNQDQDSHGSRLSLRVPIKSTGPKSRGGPSGTGRVSKIVHVLFKFLCEAGNQTASLRVQEFRLGVSICSGVTGIFSGLI